MSFMYESMVSRGPGKRKIKVQEENLLRLMQEDANDEEEEDDDFVISKEQEDLNDDSDESMDSDESSSATSSDLSSSPNVKSPSISTKPVPRNRKRPNHNRQHFSPPTIQSTNNCIKFSKKESISDVLLKAKKQLLLSTESMKKQTTRVTDSKVCWICLKRNLSNQMIVCKKCGITVHRECYGDVNNTRSSSENNSNWFCSRCVSGSSPGCEFCPSVGGCIKESTSGLWCHVVCARYILGKDIYETGIGKSLIGVSSLNYKRYGLHECTLCEDKIVSKTGITIKCDAGLCRSFFHVTCAQKYGLLSENETNQNYDTDPFFVYCPLHMEKEKMAASQKLYLIAAANQQQAMQSGEVSDNDALQNARLNYVSAQLVRFPNPQSLGEPPPRLLNSSPAAMKILARKTDLMFDIDVRSPALYFPKPSDVRKRHHVAPSLTGQFASHYADRELRIVEVKERIECLMKENNEMMDLQKELERKYNMLQTKVVSSEEQQQKVLKDVRNLHQIYARLKTWSDENKLAAKSKFKFLPIKPLFTGNQAHPKKRSSFNKSPTVNAKVSKTTPDSSALSNGLLKRCSVCNSNKHPHLLIDCDVCHRWLHLACVDPPITHMPRKSKFSVWQCSECAPSSGNESEDTRLSHGSLITSEGRRQTRRPHRPPEKLASSLVYLPQRFKKRNPSTGRLSITIKRGRADKLNNRNSKLSTSQDISVPRRVADSKKEEKPPSSNSSKLKKTDDNELSGPTVIVTRNENLDQVLQNAAVPQVLQTNNPQVLKAVNSQVLKPVKTQILKPVKLAGNKAPSVLIAIPSTPSLSLPEPATVKMDANFKQTNLSTAGQLTISPNLIQDRASNCVVVASANLAASKINFFQQATFKNVLNPDPINHSVKSGFKKRSSSPSTTCPSKLIALSPSKNKEEHLRRPEESVDRSFSNEETKQKVDKDDCEILTSPIEKCKDIVPPVCVVCSSSSDERKMMFCDYCKNYYHIWCCTPPLSSRPRKSKFFVWKCSSCYCSSEESDSSEIPTGSETTPDGRKKITRTRKPPEKFANIFSSTDQRKLMKAVLCRRRGGRKQTGVKTTTGENPSSTKSKDPENQLARKIQSELCSKIEQAEFLHQSTIVSKSITVSYEDLNKDSMISKEVKEVLEELANLTDKSLSISNPDSTSLLENRNSSFIGIEKYTNVATSVCTDEKIDDYNQDYSRNQSTSIASLCEPKAFPDLPQPAIATSSSLPSCVNLDSHQAISCLNAHMFNSHYEEVNFDDSEETSV